MVLGLINVYRCHSPQKIQQMFFTRNLSFEIYVIVHTLVLKYL
jgi:hypothetical protein